MFVDYFIKQHGYHRPDKPKIIAAIREHFSQPGTMLAITRVQGFPMKCSYRMRSQRNNQCRCGIGVLIDNKEYLPGMDAAGDVYQLLDEFYGDVLNVRSSDAKWMREVQSAHDTAHTVQEFLDKLDGLLQGVSVQV